jgi:hypothetical protein
LSPNEKEAKADLIDICQKIVELSEYESEDQTQPE